MNENPKSTLHRVVRARHPVIFIHTHDETRVLESMHPNGALGRAEPWPQ